MTAKEITKLAGPHTDRIVEGTKECTFGLANTGMCLECEAEADGVEPDAREYECSECGARAVFGYPELLIYLA